ncbi:DNA-directed RNA polymerase III subunit RPC6 [Pseudohyphozyma bogoriensis]|nr:DNA-directed RNA polymerase III subunit RPC6 [Pseudohyphozyma bogoriensis]
MPPRASTSGSAAASTSKSTKLTEVEAKFNRIGLAAPGQMISQEDLIKEAGLSVSSATVDAINSLLRKNLMTMMKDGKGNVMFKFHGKDEAKAMGSMDSEEKLVLDQIKDAGNMGIWTKDLTARTGLLRTTITKCIKALEQRKAIKAVKSVKFPTRKIYMLAGLQPSVDITGGPWFTDNELDTDFVDSLKKVVLHHLTRMTVVKDPQLLFPTSATPFLPTVGAIKAQVNAVTNGVELQDEHVESLLDLMVYDGTVEKIMVQNVQSVVNGGKKRGKDDGDSSDSDDDKRPRKKMRGGKSAKGKKGRKMLEDSDESGASDSESDDFDSDEEGGKSGAKAGSKKRRKKREKRKRVASSDEEDEDEPNGETNGKKKRNGRDTSDEGSDSDDDSKPRLKGKGKKPVVTSSAIDTGIPVNDFVYRIRRQYTPVIGWTDMPCGRCPVEAFCAEARRAPTKPASSAVNKKGAPKVDIGVQGLMQGVGMMGGVGAAIGTISEAWGETRGNVGGGVAPVNPRDCVYFKDWLDF